MRQEESSPPDPLWKQPCRTSAYADLHVHTSASDGRLSPADVVRHAVSQGFSAISICDHDTIAGLQEASLTAEELGLELIHGVELSTYLAKYEIHILGYCFDPEDSTFLSTLLEQQRYRLERLEEIIRRLGNLGVPVDRTQIDEDAAYGSIGRLHVARALVQQGLVATTREAFVKYLGKGKPAYVKRPHLSPREACRIITAAKGIPVLAHPALLANDDLIPRLLEEGVMGIEAFYGKLPPETAEHYCRLAEQRGLLITGGSDCHQSKNGECLLGNVKLDYTYVAKLKEAAAALRVNGTGIQRENQ